MKIVKGDLIALALEGKFDVIVHGCNCFCTMGSGIAKAIKAEFPEAYSADKATKLGSRKKLGTITIATIVRNDYEIAVVNAYTQYRWSGRGRRVDYDALQQAFAEIKHKFTGKRIGYPLIGAGLAGGDWSVISELIETELKGEDHTLVRFVP